MSSAADRWSQGGQGPRVWTVAHAISSRVVRLAKSMSRWQCTLILLGLTLAIGWQFDSRLYWLSRQKQLRFVTSGFREAGRQFGEPIGIVFLSLAVWVLDPRRRQSIVAMLLTAVLAGGMASTVKVLVGRERPKPSSGHTIVHGPQSFWSSDFDSGFPSGHTAAAFVLAFWLSGLYPRGQHLFIFFAASCGISRVLSSAHFLTDVLAGGWMGWETAALVWRTGWLRPDQKRSATSELGSSYKTALEVSDYRDKI